MSLAGVVGPMSDTVHRRLRDIPKLPGRALHIARTYGVRELLTRGVDWAGYPWGVRSETHIQLLRRREDVVGCEIGVWKGKHDARVIDVEIDDGAVMSREPVATLIRII